MARSASVHIDARGVVKSGASVLVSSSIIVVVCVETVVSVADALQVPHITGHKFLVKMPRSPLITQLMTRICLPHIDDSNTPLQLLRV